MPLFQKLMEIAIKRSFLLPSNEIYTQTAGFYDYGPAGVLLKHKIEDAWRGHFLRSEGFLEVETATIVPEIVLKASGHATNFADPLVTCEKCRNKFRADHLIEEAALALKTKKTAKKHSSGMHAELELELPETTGMHDDVHVKKLEGLNPKELEAKIKEVGAKCPQCGGELAEVGWFNLMFQTNIGPIEGNTAYARPETAQGIFLDFPRIFRNYSGKLPLAIGQVGKSYRNEISPRQGLVRLREFTQMELEYFFNPKYPTIENFKEKKNTKMRIATEGGKPHEKTAGEFVKDGTIPNEILAYFMAKEYEYYLSLGLPAEKFWFRKLAKSETPHYSGGNFDMEVETSYGVIETIGNAYRTDYDLSAHSKMSGVDLSVFVEEEKARMTPHVVEPSLGVDRLFWCIMEHAFRDKKAPQSPEKDWEWFDFPPSIAPFTVAVFPLMKKDGLAEKAQEVTSLLRTTLGYDVMYSESGSIGRRYARADEIGTPYCITIDYQTLQDGTVTIRYRNDGAQERIKVLDLADVIRQNVKLGKVKMR